jgi:N6-L-threonylcarbamoyladenine synthase
MFSTERRMPTMVYVLSKDNKPLMPTENHAKVRILLKTKKAEAVRRSE